MAIFTFLGTGLESLTLTTFKEVAMFLEPPFIGAITDDVVTLRLPGTCMKLVYSVYRMKIGGMGVE